jgi:hypothetical protein
MQNIGKLKHAPFLALLLALLCTLPGCKHRKVAERQTVEESGAPALASTVHMGDPRAVVQLARGFHDIEAHAWRWTMRQFSVYLRPPAGSATKGAVLILSLTVPSAVLQTGKTISLSAAVNDTKLITETWSKPGNYLYRCDVPAALLTGEAVRVDFELDRALPPSPKDARELGVVVSKVGLELK